MKKKIIILLSCIIIVLVGILLFILLRKKPILVEVHADFVYLNNRQNIIYEVEEGRVFKEYNDYKNTFNSDALKEQDFDNNNYVFIPIKYIECAEKNVKPISYTINNNTISVKVTYEKECGLCAPDELYYLLRVDKNIENVKIEFDYEQTNTKFCGNDYTEKKPIIYLYPKEQTEVTIKLLNDELITTSYPKYNNEWKVVANKDGTLIDSNNKEYYGLYWEGKNHISEIKEDGFVVKGENTVEFLEDKLRFLGLNDRERNEFIIYWLKYLENNNYNYIRFETEEEINSYMPLEVNPKPDTIIRVWMTYKPLDNKINIKDQELESINRTGFTLVEWGGSKIN